MSITINKKRYNSLVFKLIVGTLSIIVPMVFFLIFYNYYAITTLHNKVSESNRNTINLYMNQIDEDLGNIESYILNISTFNIDFSNLKSTDERTRVLSKIKLQNELTNGRSLYKSVDGFSVYLESNGEAFDSYSSRVNYKEALNISDYIEELSYHKDKYNSMGWIPIFLDSSNYLIRIFCVDNTYIGAWIKVETLMAPLLKINLQREGSILFATSEGTPMINKEFIEKNKINLRKDLYGYYFSGYRNSHMVIGKRSEVGKFSLIAVTNEKNIIQGLDIIQIVIGIIAMLSLLLIPVSLLVLKKLIFKPIKKLEYAINKIESGNLNYRIENNNCSSEFISVNNAFNNMVAQIEELKISVYEEQIRKQKFELEYLQMQIIPHFYINALNNIYSMAQMKDFKLIQDMILYLSDYLRYLFKSNFLLVPMESELKHIRNYLQIEKIHSGENLICNIDTDQNLMGVLIPPLVLQTFIENVVKHAIKPDEVTEVMIKISFIKEYNEEFIYIKIEDNGKGFREGEIHKINNYYDNRKSGEHIGIWNVKQRLNLIYGERAKIIVSNNDKSGASVEIYIPIEKEVK